MIKINAIDLDKTLIPFDSYRTLILTYLHRKYYLNIVAIHVLFRKLRLTKNGTFKYNTLGLLRKDRTYEHMVQEIAEMIMLSLRPEVMEAVDNETDPHTANVIVSASPEDYVRVVARKLGWSFIASRIADNEFVHCYGQNKIELLQKYYPRDKYLYNFAISDSDSDLEMLKMFEKHQLLQNSSL